MEIISYFLIQNTCIIFFFLPLIFKDWAIKSTIIKRARNPMTGCTIQKKLRKKCSLKTLLLFYRLLQKIKTKNLIYKIPSSCLDWIFDTNWEKKATTSKHSALFFLASRKCATPDENETRDSSAPFGIFRREFRGCVSAASKGEISLMAMKYSRTFGCCQNDMTPWGSHKGGFKEICGRFGLGGHVNPISGTRCHSLRVYLPVRGKIVRSYDKRERSPSG